MKGEAYFQNMIPSNLSKITIIALQGRGEILCRRVHSCFSRAGGSGVFFDVIERDLDGMEIAKLKCARHGTRRKEDFYKDFADLNEDVFQKLKDRYSGGECVLFSYSMGTIALAEVLKRILDTPGMKASSNFFWPPMNPARNLN